jgi:hypothetical protein
MSDSFVRIPADGVGKRLDTEELTVNALTVQRERMQIAGTADDDIAAVTDTDPAAATHGLVTRLASPTNPKLDQASSVALASGASDDLDATVISAATTGKLQQVVLSSSVAAKWVVKTRDGAVEVTLATIFTSGVAGGKPTEIWSPPSKDYATLAGAGVDENFRITVTNLDPTFAADANASFVWDEI